MSRRSARPAIVRRLGVAVAAVLLSCPAAGAADPPWTGTCVDVVDGDTIVVERDGQRLELELEAIDAPELAQAWGEQARQRAADLMLGKELTLHPRRPGANGQAMVRPVVDGTDVSRALLEAGLAWHDTARNSEEALLLAMMQARSSAVGLWSDPQPMRPEEWLQSLHPTPRPTPVPSPTPTPRARLNRGFNLDGDDAGSGGSGGALVISDGNIAEYAAEGRVGAGGSGRSTTSSTSDTELSAKNIELLEAQINQLEEELLEVQDSADTPNSDARLQTIQRKLAEKRRLLSKHRSRPEAPTPEPRREASSDADKKRYWQERYEQLKMRVSEARAEVERLSSRVAELEAQFRAVAGLVPEGHTSWDSVADAYLEPRARAVRQLLRQTEDDLRSAERKLRRAEDELARLPDEARRDGAQPGWFR